MDKGECGSPYQHIDMSQQRPSVVFWVLFSLQGHLALVVHSPGSAVSYPVINPPFPRLFCPTPVCGSTDYLLLTDWMFAVQALSPAQEVILGS